MDISFYCAGSTDDDSGLALFYGGMVRKKNVLATMAHSFVAAAIVSITWVVIGYSLAFSEGNALWEA